MYCTGDVFWEAFKAWQRRQYEIKELADEGKRSGFTTGPAWGMDRGEAQSAAPQSADGRKIAGLAATAARAARLWRHYEKSKKTAGLLDA